jgi:hypothetical protein
MEQEKYTFCGQCGSKLLVPVYQCNTCKQLDLLKKISSIDQNHQPRYSITYSDFEPNNFLLGFQIILMITGTGFLAWLMWYVGSGIYSVISG